MKIYTKTGDRGETGLLGPLRVPKDHPRIAAYGEVDELNAAIGLALAVAAAGEAGAAGASRVVRRPARPRTAGSRSLRVLLQRVQRDLFVVGSELATVPQPHRRAPILRPIRAGDIAALEKAIDRATDRVPPLSNFILPGGTRLAAALHLARTVCRRAERAVVALSHAEPVPPNVIVYLNRLSDLLFVLARVANAEAGVGDVPWVPRKPKA